MNRELIDFLLGELPEAEAAEMERRLEREPELAREAATYEESLAILRTAAREETWAPARSRFRWIAAAAALIVAVGLLWMNGAEPERTRHFEPDGAFGALFPEELGEDGSMRPSFAPHDGYRLERGALRVGAIGARTQHPLAAGDPVLEDSEIACGADAGALLSLPQGGMLFLRPLSTAQLRSRDDGRVALRLLSGAAATVAGTTPIHLAVNGTDLLLTQHDGAALLRHQESDALCLRGRLELHLESGERWRIPPGHRLPAACAHEPESETYRVDWLDLDWYEALAGFRAWRDAVTLDADGVSAPLLGVGPDTLVYVAAESRDAVTLTLRYGEDGPGRSFRTVPGRTLEVRVPVAALGNGPRLVVTPVTAVTAVRQVRLFEPR